MDSSYHFVKFAESTTFDSVPKELISLLKKDVLDTLGNILAGSGEPITPKLLNVMSSLEGKAESQVIAYPTRLPVGDAAMLNASMAFALDYDDIHEPSRTHFGCSAIPTALAVAEAMKLFDGRKVLTALAVALELAARLGKYMIRRNPTQIMGGWDYAALHAYLYTAVIAGKLMDFDQKTLGNALGIAYHQCAGTSVSAMDHADTKILGPGLAARGGILAAKLASAGITGATSIFDSSDISMDSQYHNGVDKQAFAGELGKRWEALELGFKAYPCCRLIHRHIDAALELAQKYEIEPEEIRVIHATYCPMIAPMCQASRTNCHPATKLEAQFSVPYTVVCALARRKVAIDEFDVSAFTDPVIAELTEKYEAEVDEGLSSLDDPAELTVVTERGRFTVHTGHPLGAPENPISQQALQEKFFDCAAHGKRPIRKEQAQKLVDLVEHLDEAYALPEMLELLRQISNAS